MDVGYDGNVVGGGTITLGVTMANREQVIPRHSDYGLSEKFRNHARQFLIFERSCVLIWWRRRSASEFEKELPSIFQKKLIRFTFPIT